jgi:hypothetical protein
MSKHSSFYYMSLVKFRVFFGGKYKFSIKRPSKFSNHLNKLFSELVHCESEISLTYNSFNKVVI